MKKIVIVIISTISAVILASIFGALNNQISYSISPEFFTKSMFPLFGFVEYGLDTPRLTAAIIGIWSTWWLGLIIGLIYSTLSLSKGDSKIMITYIKSSLLITFSITILSGILGFVFGKIFFANELITWGFQGTQEQLKNFITVSYIHNFEYGGTILAILGIILNTFIKWPSHNRAFTQ